jgi:chorismate mutase
MTECVEALRERIERVDREILDRVAERVSLSREIGRLKREAHGPTLVPEREAAVIRHAAELAREAGLDPEDVRELFWVLVGMCRRAQLADG